MCSSGSILCSSNCTFFLQELTAAPQASWLDSGEENGKREAKKSGRKKRRKGKGKKVEGDKGEKRGKKENEGGKGGILCSCDFSLGETLGQLIYKLSRSRNISRV